jgi:hypothetical protein
MHEHKKSTISIHTHTCTYNTHTHAHCSCSPSFANTSQCLPEGCRRYLRTLRPGVFERRQLYGRPGVLFQWVWPILCRSRSGPILRYPSSVPHLRRQRFDHRDMCADQCQLSDQSAVRYWWRALLSEWLWTKVSNSWFKVGLPAKGALISVAKLLRKI